MKSSKVTFIGFSPGNSQDTLGSRTPQTGTAMPTTIKELKSSKDLKSFDFNAAYFPFGKFSLFNSEDKMNITSVIAKIDDVLLTLDTCTGAVGKGYLNKIDLTEYPIIKDILPFFIKTPKDKIEQAYNYLAGDKAKDSYQ
jgi:hypothetical protein